MLAALPAPERPDALLINDDHLMEKVASGLARTNLLIGREFDVVSHCNFPLFPAVTVPVKFLGYDVVAILQTCVELLAARREGRQLEMITPWEPVFDDEIIGRPTTNIGRSGINALPPAGGVIAGPVAPELSAPSRSGVLE